MLWCMFLVSPVTQSELDLVSSDKLLQQFNCEQCQRRSEQWSYYRMAKIKSAESPKSNTSDTSKASKVMWWNFELLAESLVWHPMNDHWLGGVRGADHVCCSDWGLFPLVWHSDTWSASTQMDCKVSGDYFHQYQVVPSVPYSMVN